MDTNEKKVRDSWDVCERQMREAFEEWASYRLKVFAETSSAEWNVDGRVARYMHLLEATAESAHMAKAWSATLEPTSSIIKAQHLARVLRSGDSLAQFLSKVNSFMRAEIGLLPLIKKDHEASLPPRSHLARLLFRRYERRLPSYNIPANLDLMVESALYAIYVAWSPSSRVIIPDTRKELWRAISMSDETLRVVTPRRFEELVAFVYEQLGCRVEVTAATNDKGADVLAWHPGPFGTESLIVVQTKLYSGERRVDLAGVHALHGAVAHYNATHGHLVATTDTTRPARQFLDARGYQFIDLLVLRRAIEAILQ